MNTLQNIRRIFSIFKASEGTIRPHFILTGPSGSGKSHTIEMLCSELGIQVLQVNAAGLTKEGTAGNSLSKALVPLIVLGDMPVVVFVDEFDKLFISGNSNTDLAHEITNGVQNEFLKVLEGTASVFGEYGRYHPISTNNVLFVFAGAFNGEADIGIDRLRDFGVKTEFIGRVGLSYSLTKPTLAEMEVILKNSSLLHNYLAVFNDVDKQVVVKEVMAVVTKSYEKNTLGVRVINTLIHQYFINGGLKEKEAKQVTFQKTLSLNS